MNDSNASADAMASVLAMVLREEDATAELETLTSLELDTLRQFTRELSQALRAEFLRRNWGVQPGPPHITPPRRAP
jgi:hypothetical protein